MGARGGRWPVVVLGLLAAALLLLAAGRVWADGRVEGLAGPVAITVTGRQAQPLVPALGLIAGAAAAVLAICGPVVRWAAGAVLVLAGAGATAACLAARDADALLRPVAAGSSAVTGSAVQGETLSAWPWLAAAAGLLAVAAGVRTLAAGAPWADAGRRYQRADQAAGAAGPAPVVAPAEDPIAAWDALSRGEDPTSDEPGR